MTVEYVTLGRHDGWIWLKCFFAEHELYGEFFLYIHQDKGLIRFEPKDDAYAPVLTAAFQAGMVEG